MSDKKASELSASELLELAAEKLGIEGESLSDLEIGLASATQKLTCLELERRLNEEENSKPKKCPTCGTRCRVRVPSKERRLRTMSGDVVYRRNYHYCDGCSQGFYPRDNSLGIPQSGDVSLELERRLLDFSMNDPFEQGALRFSLHYSQPSSSNLLRRVFDRNAQKLDDSDEEWIQHAMKAPSKEPLSKTVVVESDGSMISTTQGWKEIKLGMVYNHQSDTTKKSQDEEKRSTPRFVATMAGIIEFEDMLEQALDSHCNERPKVVLWLGDGAKGFWNIAKRVCPSAIEILDWYHAISHAADCAKVLFDDSLMQELWVDNVKCQLKKKNGVEHILDDLEGCLFLAESESQRKAIKDLRRYYKNHQKRMDYHRYRKNGWPIGSGSIESAHRYVLQARMKRSGQHWSPKNADKMAKMRAAYITASPRNFHNALGNALKCSKLAA